jgi:Fe-S-cluster containining protein
MIVPLSRVYTAYPGAPAVEWVDTRIFRLTYFHECMACTFCHDRCCQYGATVEKPKVRAILDRANELEPLIGVPSDQWFEAEWWPDADYPGGEYTRTRLRDGACVFLNRNGRGCLLHRFALQNEIPVHDIKPIACNMFPVLFDAGTLIVPLEIDDGTLICLGKGPTIYQSSRSDLRHYFGLELVDELDALERREVSDALDRSKSMTLPLVTDQAG